MCLSSSCISWYERFPPCAVAASVVALQGPSECVMAAVMSVCSDWLVMCVPRLCVCPCVRAYLQTAEVIKIQAFLRARKAKSDYTLLGKEWHVVGG